MERNGSIRRLLHRFSWSRATTLTVPTAVMVLAGCLAQSQATPPTLYEVKLEHIWIPMHDSVRLAAWLLRPAHAPAGEKFPAIFKLAPYRNDDTPGNIFDC